MVDYSGWCCYTCFSLLVVFLSGNIFVITFKIFLFAETKYEGKYSTDGKLHRTPLIYQSF
jgi:hypothetical protein